MSVRQRARRALTGLAALTAMAAVALTPASASAAPNAPSGIKHIVVIYEENHSFDNLFGGWEGVNGLANAGTHATQVDPNGAPLPCLPQNDPVLKGVTGPSKCPDLKFNDGSSASSPFANQPFRIDDHITPETKSCPGNTPGGCTRDLVHRFYQEQYQIDGGRMDRYTVGSDALGLTQGYYDTRNLRLYRYLHSPEAPHYAIADNFFQAAFGGSFLNHQWLIAAKTPVYPDAPDNLHAVVGPNGMPTAYPLMQPVKGVNDAAPLTQAAVDATGTCRIPAPTADTPVPPVPPPGTVCGDYAVNTIQPASVPQAPSGARLPLQTYATIGDRLTAKSVDWAWYSGGWDNATGNTAGKGYTAGPGPSCGNGTVANPAYPKCPDPLFQYHHQPFNYFATYAEGGAGRGHLQDEKDFLDAVDTGTLKPVSFVKPVGAENQHPGYASTDTGDRHLVDLLKKVAAGPNAADTAVIVTYDEFGGQWDHVSPPKVDRWGPGTRIPALVISPKLPKRFAVDHTVYDTTSVLATIEHLYGLKPLTERDANAADLRNVFTAPAGPGGEGEGGGSGGGLPITGTNLAGLVVAAVVLLLAGGGAVVLTRRRDSGTG